ncbi:hypothetical protein [Aeromonas veronii]|uniref:hypothetical protein n=1 Tax=Aeromonas veronii TaxID=654 RepID=UPI0029D7C799|nr:hypothetical protein [Aeromonas veronii]MDX7876282.1 hypothetical protein [Aeromonas veronii]
MTQQGIKKQPKGAAVKPLGETSNPSGEPLEVVLRELAAIKQSLALSQLPAIPLEAFLNMLRDDFNIDLPVRTAQAMIADGRIPQMPKLRHTDKPWVNLVRWREMAKEPSNYLHMAHENSRHRIAKPATTKSKQQRAA